MPENLVNYTHRAWGIPEMTAKIIDVSKVEGLAAQGLTFEQIALSLGISEDHWHAGESKMRKLRRL